MPPGRPVFLMPKHKLSYSPHRLNTIPCRLSLEKENIIVEKILLPLDGSDFLSKIMPQFEYMASAFGAGAYIQAKSVSNCSDPKLITSPKTLHI